MIVYKAAFKNLTFIKAKTVVCRSSHIPDIKPKRSKLSSNERGFVITLASFGFGAVTLGANSGE